MPKLTAVGWDGREARFVLGTINRGKLKILDSGSQAIIRREDEQGNSEPDIATTLREMFDTHRISKPSALIALNRSSVEIIHFELPPALEAELPDMVRNQTLQDAPSLDEKSPIDYITTDEGDPTESRKVTAVALPVFRLKQLKATCTKASIRPLRMPLRSFATIGLYLRSEHRTDEPCLLINHVADELDLTVLVQGKPVYSRTVRMPDTTDPVAINNRVVEETNRTLAVALQDHWSGAVKQVFLFGSLRDEVDLVGMIADRLSLEVKLIDPFATVQSEAGSIPNEPGRFAPLVGMLLDEAFGAVSQSSASRASGHPVDLLHPKRKPKPKNYLKPVAVVLAVLLLAAFLFYQKKMGEIKQLDTEIASLAEEYQKLYAQNQIDARRRTTIQTIRLWESQGVNWLDELRDLSIRLPQQDQFVATRLSFTSTQPGIGSINLSGRGTADSLGLRIQAIMKDQYHTMQTPRILTVSDSNYRYQIDAAIMCRRRPTSVYFTRLPKELQVANYQYVRRQAQQQATQPVQQVTNTQQQVTPQPTAQSADQQQITPQGQNAQPEIQSTSQQQNTSQEQNTQAASQQQKPAQQTAQQTGQQPAAQSTTQQPAPQNSVLDKEQAYWWKWYQNATPEQRAALNDQQKQYIISIAKLVQQQSGGSTPATSPQNDDTQDDGVQETAQETEPGHGDSQNDADQDSVPANNTSQNKTTRGAEPDDDAPQDANPQAIEATNDASKLTPSDDTPAETSSKESTTPDNAEPEKSSDDTTREKGAMNGSVNGATAKAQKPESDSQRHKRSRPTSGNAST